VTALKLALTAAGYASAAEHLAKIAADCVAMTPEQWAEYRGSITNAEQDRIQRRLMQVAREAIQAAPRNWDGAKDAFYAKVRRDPDLLWELLAPYRAQAVQLYLTQAAAALREEQKPRVVADTRSGAGQVHREHQESDARTATAPKSEGGHFADVDRSPYAPRASVARGATAVMAVTRLSLLDTFKVNGQSIGDLTSAEAVKWAGSRERDARFVRLLTANLPPDQLIKKYRTGEDAAALYAQAETGHAE